MVPNLNILPYGNTFGSALSCTKTQGENFTFVDVSWKKNTKIDFLKRAFEI